MASTPSKSKTPRNKPPKGRPVTTSAISQPTVEDASSTHPLSSFSPKGELFAFLSPAVDKHRLPQTVRYTENASIAIRSGVELGQDASMDDLAMREIEGELDADLAEMSLGQRLAATTGEASNAAPKGSSSDDEDASPSKKADNATPQAIPAASLTRTLIQALHSSDSGLLETCLAHSNTTLILNTVKRLPSQLAVPLVTACVERLGRGKRVGRGKGGGGGAGAQRGTGLVRWVRAVLVIHGGHLLTVRLSL